MASKDEIVAALSDPIRTVITPNRWKYSLSARGEEELYELNADPDETTNLAGKTKYAGLIKELRSEIAAWQKRTGDIVRLPC